MIMINPKLIAVFFLSVGLCNGVLGLQNGRLKNKQITASSSWPGLYTWRARLHHSQAWCARYNNHNQWLKFDLLRPTKVTGIALQGRSNVHQWVTRFLLHSSLDNVHWNVYRYKNNDKVSIYGYIGFAFLFFWLKVKANVVPGSSRSTVTEIAVEGLGTRQGKSSNGTEWPTRRRS